MGMMKPLLLDTHALLWWMLDDPQLPGEVRRRMALPEQQVYVSAATVWEIAIKTRRGRLQGAEDYLQRHAAWHVEWGFASVAIDAEDARCAGGFPFEHADPFDRVLMAQSLRLDAELATCDEAIRQVHTLVFWA